MSFRTDLLAVVDGVRAISGPTGVDIRTHQLTIRTRTWSGTYVKEGVPVDADLVLPARYPVRNITGQEVEASGGRYLLDDVLVNHITPSNGAGVGFTPSDLRPPITAENVETIYLLDGPYGGEFKLHDANFLRPFSYSLILRRALEARP